MPSESDLVAAIKRANGIELEPYKDEFLDAPLTAIESGEVISDSYDEVVDTHTWELSNGIQVVVKSTDFRMMKCSWLLMEGTA